MASVDRLRPPPSDLAATRTRWRSDGSHSAVGGKAAVSIGSGEENERYESERVQQ